MKTGLPGGNGNGILVNSVDLKYAAKGGTSVNR